MRSFTRTKSMTIVGVNTGRIIGLEYLISYDYKDKRDGKIRFT